MDNQQPITTLTKRSSHFKNVNFSERTIKQINAQYNVGIFYKTRYRVDSLTSNALHLHSVSFQQCFFQSVDWINSVKWEQLKQLSFRQCTIPKKCTIKMKNFPKLENFTLSQSLFNPYFFIDFQGEQSHLKKIVLLITRVKEIDFRSLKNLQEIEISLTCSDLILKKMVEADLPHLQRLYIFCQFLKSVRYLSCGKWESLKKLTVSFGELIDHSASNPFKNLAYSQFPILEKLAVNIQGSKNIAGIQAQQLLKIKYNLKSFKIGRKFLYRRDQKQESKFKDRFNETTICKVRIP